jgi:hypothetical protein
MRTLLVAMLLFICLSGCQRIAPKAGPLTRDESGGSSRNGYESRSPEAQNEFEFFNRSSLDLASVRVELGETTVELGPVPVRGLVKGWLPAGSPGYFYVSWTLVNGGEGGGNLGSPVDGPMFRKRHFFVLSDQGSTCWTGERDPKRNPNDVAENGGPPAAIARAD